MESIEAVFLDIDGTLVDGREVIESAAAAVEILQKNGLFVALCTGRSVTHTREIQNRLGIKQAVYFNGCYAEREDEAIFSNPLTEDVVKRAVSFAEQHQLSAIFHSNKRAMTLNDNLPIAIENMLTGMGFPILELNSGMTSYDEEQVFQINLFAKNVWDENLSKHFPECLLYRWEEHAVDLQNRRCDKSHGATALLQTMNIPRERSLHIGDGDNDVGMFQTMGFSVAMGNASRDVQQHANMVTTPVDQDGVWLALKRLNLI